MVIVLLILALFCAVQAVRTPRLLTATIWLGAVSAFVAVMLYGIGAPEIAVIELSVGAGLVTVLMVFAITMVGDERESIQSARGLLLIFALLTMLLIVGLTLPLLQPPTADEGTTVTGILWEERGLDVVAQIAMLFAGVLGVLGLLSQSKTTVKSKAAQPPIPIRTIMPSYSPEPVEAFTPREKEQVS